MRDQVSTFQYGKEGGVSRPLSVTPNFSPIRTSVGVRASCVPRSRAHSRLSRTGVPPVSRAPLASAPEILVKCRYGRERSSRRATTVLPSASLPSNHPLEFRHNEHSRTGRRPPLGAVRSIQATERHYCLHALVEGTSIPVVPDLRKVVAVVGRPGGLLGLGGRVLRRQTEPALYQSARQALNARR